MAGKSCEHDGRSASLEDSAQIWICGAVGCPGRAQVGQKWEEACCVGHEHPHEWKFAPAPCMISTLVLWPKIMDPVSKAQIVYSLERYAGMGKTPDTLDIQNFLSCFWNPARAGCVLQDAARIVAAIRSLARGC